MGQELAGGGEKSTPGGPKRTSGGEMSTTAGKNASWTPPGAAPSRLRGPRSIHVVMAQHLSDSPTSSSTPGPAECAKRLNNKV